MSLDKEQLNDFIEDLKFLATKHVIEHTELNTLKQLLKTEHIKEYLDIVPQVKPESAMSDKIITPLLEALGIQVSPQVNTGSSWVDYAISINDRNPVGLEVKPMFIVATKITKTTAKLKINELEEIFNKLKNEFVIDKKNQITLYLKKYDYIIFTNGVDVFYFNRAAESDFNYFYREAFIEFVEKIRTNKNVHDVVAKIEEEKFIGKKKDLDKEFFLDLKQWYTALGSVKWIGDVNEINRTKITLLDKLIFVQTLEDFSLVPFKIMINEFEEKEQKWKTKGGKRVVEEFMEEINNWFYAYYDTELFKEDILKYLEDSEANYTKFLDILKSIIGVGSWEVAFRKGLGHYNYKYIDEDIFGKAYETFLAENRKEEGIYYTPRAITSYMAESIVDEVFKEDKDKLIEILSHNPTVEEFEEAKRIVRRLVSKGVIDIASGSGSFLIKVLRKIYNIYDEINKSTEWAVKGATSIYSPEDITAFMKKVQEIRKILGMNVNTSSLRRRLVSLIILRHIYGIDLDRGAVEVAKANLWKEAIKLSPDAFRFEKLKGDTNHVLPNLTTNLIHGNSILTLPDEEIIEFISKNFKNEITEMIILRDKYLENPEDPTFIEKIAPVKEKIREELGKKFDTNYPAFYPLEFPQFYFDESGEPLLEEERGFSGVIGNPPYSSTIDKQSLAKLKAFFSFYDSRGNSASFFTELANKLTKYQKGEVAFILPKSLSFADGWHKVRELVAYNNTLQKIIDVSKAFEDVKLEQNIIIFKSEYKDKYDFISGEGWGNSINIIGKYSNTLMHKLDILPVYLDQEKMSIYNKMMDNSVTLGSKSETFRGLPLQKYVTTKGKGTLVLKGKNINKYSIYGNIDTIKMPEGKELSEKASKICQKKIISQNIVAHVMNPYDQIVVMATLDYNEMLSLDTVMNTIITDIDYSYEYVLALLNSKLAAWFYYWFVYNRAIRTMHFDNYYIGKLPIKSIDVLEQKPFVDLVQQILSITHKDTYDPKTDADDNKKVKDFEDQINQLVYKLYGLTDDEIKTIEGKNETE